MKRKQIEKTFNSLEKQEENQKNKNYTGFLEDDFEIADEDAILNEEKNYLADYNRKYGFFSRFLSILICVLVIIIIYQIITIISYYA